MDVTFLALRIDRQIRSHQRVYAFSLNLFEIYKVVVVLFSSSCRQNILFLSWARIGENDDYIDDAQEEFHFAINHTTAKSLNLH